ncbi:TlpA disulfide reductase family protein [Fluviicola taffensis]|uniref:TlpA family protein disulfide reductase n=1 Tax=Fluviicola taffensis TaxID=191579 RepID=UPI00313815FE
MSELDTNLIQFIGEEKIGSNMTVHYRFVPLKDTNDAVEILNSALDFWINEKDNIPIRYSVYYQVDLSGDTLEQYDEFNLTSYSLGNQENHKFKTPDYFVKNGIHLSEYVVSENESDEKLLVGSKVPDWEFMTNKKINYTSTNLSYGLVLFDFYYQSCYPCLKAIPFLNKLNKKYDLKGRGLLVVGINDIDPVDERFYEFIKKKQIGYSLAVSPNKLNEEFKVSGYPTIFLMNNKGELIYSSEGYGEQLEVELESIIVEHLKQEGLLK